MCSNVVDCSCIIRFENTKTFHVFSLQMLFDSGRHIQNIHYTLKKIFDEWNLYQFRGSKKVTTTALQRYYSNTKATQNLMCLRERELLPLWRVLLCVNSLIFAVDTVQCSSASGKNGLFLFSESETHILLYTLGVCAHTNTSCHWHFLVCWLATSLLFHFHFQWSISDKTTHACPKHTRTHPQKCKQKPIIFCFVTAFFACQTHIYSSQCSVKI